VGDRLGRVWEDGQSVTLGGRAEPGIAQGHDAIDSGRHETTASPAVFNVYLTSVIDISILKTANYTLFTEGKDSEERLAFQGSGRSSAF
jgi:hypothetical protein